MRQSIHEKLKGKSLCVIGFYRIITVVRNAAETAGSHRTTADHSPQIRHYLHPIGNMCEEDELILSSTVDHDRTGCTYIC